LTPRTEAPAEAKTLSQAFSNVAKALRPSVVRIDVEVTRPEGGETGQMSPDDVPPFFRKFFDFGHGGGGKPEPQRGTGSGIVIDGAGHIVTNRHVVNGATRVMVTLSDGKELPAKVVGTDSQTDVAVIQLLSPPKDLVAGRLGDSDKLDVGEWVLAVGSPLGLDQTVTAGIVSSKGRVGAHVHMSGDRVRQYIQTDAMINPGNSGGPLVNLSSEVVGINTLINTGPGGAYGFAIPVNQVRAVANSLMKDGRVHYAYLGVLVGDLASLDPAKKAQLGGNLPANGAFVNDVTPGGPAGKAGVKPNDVITSLDGQPVTSAGDVIDEVSTRTIGAPVKLGLIRQGKRTELTVALGELPTAEGRGAPTKTEETGMSLQTLTPPLAESLGLPPSTHGAVVAEVTEGGQAEKAGIAAGDVVIEIDRHPINTAEEAESALRNAHKGGHLLRIRGPNGSRFVTLGGG